MMRRDRKLRCLYIGVDYLSTIVGVMVFALMRFFTVGVLHVKYAGFGAFLCSHGSKLTLALFPLFMLMVYAVSGYYVNVTDKSRIREFLNTICCVSAGSLAYFMVVLLNDVLPGRMNNYEILLLLFISLFVVVYGSRLLLTSVIKGRNRARNGRMRLILLGNDHDGMLSGQAYKSFKEIVATIDVGYGMPVAGLHENLSAALRSNKAAGFLLAPSSLAHDEWLKIISELYLLDLPIFVTADDYRILTSRVVYDNLMSEPFMDISRPSLPDSEIAVKRCLDVFGSALGLVLASPVMLVLAVLVKAGSKGPVFYSQERIGYHRVPFKIHKFRSMYEESESDGPALSSENDARITKLGRFMRKYRLDELPNLWNVLRGDMSLVGPRPEREYFLRQMRESAPYCSLLHQVRPGLTSLGMVKFGYARSVDEMLCRLKYDLIYLQNLSLSLDLKIMFYTLKTLVKGKGM